MLESRRSRPPPRALCRADNKGREPTLSTGPPRGLCRAEQKAREPAFPTPPPRPLGFLVTKYFSLQLVASNACSSPKLCIFLASHVHHLFIGFYLLTYTVLSWPCNVISHPAYLAQLECGRHLAYDILDFVCFGQRIAPCLGIHSSAFLIFMFNPHHTFAHIIDLFICIDFF